MFSGWSPFNSSKFTIGLAASKVRFLQPVNESPTEVTAMYTVLKRSQYLAACMGLREVDCVFDQACFAKACVIKICILDIDLDLFFTSLFFPTW